MRRGRITLPRRFICTLPIQGTASDQEPERRKPGKLITFATCPNRVLRRETFLTRIRWPTALDLADRDLLRFAAVRF